VVADLLRYPADRTALFHSVAWFLRRLGGRGGRDGPAARFIRRQTQLGLSGVERAGGDDVDAALQLVAGIRAADTEPARSSP
jgi:hypothetical protein